MIRAAVALLGCALFASAATAQEQQWYMSCPACAAKLGGTGRIGPFSSREQCLVEYRRNRAEGFPVSECRDSGSSEDAAEQQTDLISSAAEAAVLAAPEVAVPALAGVAAIGVIWGALDSWSKERQTQAARDRAMAAALAREIEAEKRRVEAERRRKIDQTRQYLLANVRGVDGSQPVTPRTVRPSDGFRPRTTADLDREESAAAPHADAALLRELMEYFGVAPIAVVGLNALVESEFFYALQSRRAPMPAPYRSPIRTGQDMVRQVPELARSPAVALIVEGADALIARNWPLALELWQAALLRDSGNAALQRSVDMARWMVDRERGVAWPATEAVRLANEMALKRAPAAAFAFLIDGTKNDPTMASSVVEEWDRRFASSPEYLQARATYYEVMGTWPATDPQLAATMWAANGSFEGAFATLRSATADDPDAARQVIHQWDAQFASNPHYRSMRSLFYETTGVVSWPADGVQASLNMAAKGGDGYYAGLAGLLAATRDDLALRDREIAAWNARFGGDPEWRNAIAIYHEIELEADLRIIETITLDVPASPEPIAPAFEAMHDAVAEQSELDAVIRQRLRSVPDETPELAGSPAAALIRSGNDAALANDWHRAVSSFEDAQRLDPANASIQRLLFAARIMRDISKLTEPAQAALAAVEDAVETGFHTGEDDEETVRFLMRAAEFCHGPRKATAPDCELVWAANNKNEEPNDPSQYLSRRNAEHYLYVKSTCDGTIDFTRRWSPGARAALGVAGATAGQAIYGLIIKNGMIAVDNPYLNRVWNGLRETHSLRNLNAQSPTSPFLKSPATWGEVKWGLAGALECWQNYWRN